LHRAGFTVLGAVDGPQVLRRWQMDRPHLVLLDGTLPTIDGFEVCRRIRQESRIPIILVSALDNEHDIIRGLHLGADDYVTKPFSMTQLLARMHAVLRRTQASAYREPTSALRAENLVLDLHARQVAKGARSCS
jgi:DNA-binding response OmpR family regulator